MPDFKHPFLRVPSSNLFTHEAIIRNRGYQLKIHRQPQVIVDAGANIILSSLFFANQYPAAKIIAIEPRAKNFGLLQRNTALYPNTLPL